MHDNEGYSLYNACINEGDFLHQDSTGVIGAQ
jgi:hypothetical protein